MHLEDTLSYRNALQQIAQGLQAQIRNRISWFQVAASAPASASIGWQATLLGRLMLDESVMIHDFAYLHAGLLDPNREYIKIGAGSTVLPMAQIHSWGGFVEVGAQCSVNAYTILYGTGGIHIGNLVRIAAHTVVVASSHNFALVDRPIKQQGYKAQGVIIEDDVWVGANCCILDGVRVGHGAIIAAGAVVNRDVAPYDIVGGVPATVIRNRLEEAQTGAEAAGPLV